MDKKKRTFWIIIAALLVVGSVGIGISLGDVGIQGEATGGDGSKGVYGKASNAGDVRNYGGFFVADGSFGRGVYGKASNTGNNISYGGFFYASGEQGRGVFGQAAGSSGYGVKGWASNDGDVENYGGHFTATGSKGIGVYGWAENEGSGENYGGYFVAEGGNGTGVYGRGSEGGYFTTTTAGSYGNELAGVNVSTAYKCNPGVRIETTGLLSQGVYAHTTGYDSDGVYARTDNDDSDGVYAHTYGEDSAGVNVITSGDSSQGVWARTHGNYSSGVSASTYGDHSYGVYAYTLGYDSDGVHVKTTGEESEGVYVETTGYNSEGVYVETAADDCEGVVVYTQGLESEAVYVKAYGVGSEGVYAYSEKAVGVYSIGKTYDFYAGGPGTNYGPFTGAHEVKLSADFPENVTPGMIVSVTGETQVRQIDGRNISFSSTLPTVQLSDTPNDSKVLGVFISESPLPEEHWYINESIEGDRFGIVNALGEGRVWVIDINGDIEAGDYITTSLVAGYGQKQDDDLLHSYTLGKAIESVNWSNVSTTVEFNGQTYRAYPIAVVYTSG